MDPDGPGPLILAATHDLPGADTILTDHGGGVASVAWTAGAGDAGSYVVSLSAVDALGNRAEQAVAVNVAPNQPPVVTPIADHTIEEGDSLAIDIFATDDGPLPLTLEVTNNLPGGTDVFTDLGGGTGAITWFAEPGSAGTFSLTVEATDGFGHSGSTVFSVTVDPAP